VNDSQPDKDAELVKVMVSDAQVATADEKLKDSLLGVEVPTLYEASRLLKELLP
jgi:rRNA-processing protein FCF1